MDTQQLSATKRTIVGIQYLFVAFGSIVIVPLLIGINPATALFTAGMGTFLFHFITKGKVPIFLGSSFAFVAPIIAATKQWGYPGTMAGLTAVPLVYFLMTALIKWQGKNFLKELFPPVVVGPVIILVGLSLASNAIEMARTNWLLAFISLATAITILTLCHGLIKLIPILCGIIVGYVLAICMGVVDFSGIAAAPWLELPVTFDTITHFEWSPFLYMIPVAIAPVFEHLGDVYVVGAVTKEDYAKEPGIHRTLFGNGMACLLSSFLGGPPETTYSEVTGAMSMTKVTSPAVIRIAAATAVCISVVGKLNALLQSIPKAVLGGIMLLLFGTIATVGMQNLIHNKVDLNLTRNVIIISVMLTIGLGSSVIASGEYAISGIGLATDIGVVLNLILPKPKKEDTKKEDTKKGQRAKRG